MNWFQKIKTAQQGLQPPWTQTWEEFIAYHKTGYIDSNAYGDGTSGEGGGYDLSHYNDQNQHQGRNSPEQHPILLDKKTFNTPRYGEVEVEFRQSGEDSWYVKHGPPDEHGLTDHLRDESGNLIYLSPEEMAEKDLSNKDKTIHI